MCSVKKLGQSGTDLPDVLKQTWYSCENWNVSFLCVVAEQKIMWDARRLNPILLEVCCETFSYRLGVVDGLQAEKRLSWV